MIQYLPLLLAVQTFEHKPIDFTAVTTLSFAQPTEGKEETLTVGTSTWGTKDTWRWNIQGGYAEDVKDSSNTITSIGVEFDYFIEDDLSLDLGFFGLISPFNCVGILYIIRRGQCFLRAELDSSEQVTRFLRVAHVLISPLKLVLGVRLTLATTTAG